MQHRRQAQFQFVQVGGGSGQDVSMLDSARNVMSGGGMQHGNDQFVQRQGGAQQQQQGQGWQFK